MTFVHTLRVRYVECDMQNRVFNAHYVTWMDIAHTAFFQATVCTLDEFAAAGADFVVAEANARFLAAARFDDDVDIAVTLDPLGTTSMTSRYAMSRAGELLVEGWLRHVCVDARTYAKRPWPDRVRTVLAERE